MILNKVIYLDKELRQSRCKNEIEITSDENY